MYTETIADVVENGRQLEYNRYVIESMIIRLGGNGSLAYTSTPEQLSMYLTGLLDRRLVKLEDALKTALSTLTLKE